MLASRIATAASELVLRRNGLLLAVDRYGRAEIALSGDMSFSAPQLHCPACKRTFVPPLLGLGDSDAYFVYGPRYHVVALILDVWNAERSVKASRVIDLDADDEDVTADEARAFYDFAAMLARDEEPAAEIVGVGADEDEDIEAAVFAGAAHGGVSTNEDDDTHVGMDGEAVPVDLAESRLARSIEEATRVLAASASAAVSAAAVS